MFRLAAFTVALKLGFVYTTHAHMQILLHPRRSSRVPAFRIRTMQGLLWLGSWGKLFCGGYSNTRAIARAMALPTVGLARLRATPSRFCSSATPYIVLRSTPTANPSRWVGQSFLKKNSTTKVIRHLREEPCFIARNIVRFILPVFRKLHAKL